MREFAVARSYKIFSPPVSMANAGPSEEQERELLFRICDKRTLEALNTLKIVSPSKEKHAKGLVVASFERTKQMIDYETYKRLIANLNTEASISIQRKTNMFDLDEIDEDEL